ncbi:MAG: cob(I)yrinic acid a,c-diamide adenosyltransferase [Ginsengibacter sp.]
MSQKIYTKTGDDGSTSLIGGTKLLKSDLRIEAYGTVDELNSFIGLVGDHSSIADTKSALKEIQDRLFTIGSSLACDPNKNTGMHIPDLHESDVTLLESKMDAMNEDLPIMKHFVLPGGDPAVSVTHIARCVCRRAERCCVRLKTVDESVSPLIIKYLNRLSDYLFVLARFFTHKMDVPEVIWKPRL